MFGVCLNAANKNYYDDSESDSESKAKKLFDEQL